jgi:hypothetical protein
MKKKMLMLTGVFMLVLLCGCWKTIGNVDMSKVVSLEEVWENSDKYIGKVVTVELDTVANMFKGGVNLPQGEQYSIAGLTLNNRYLRTQEQYTKLWDAYIDSVGGKDSARGDTVFTGDYEVGFIFDNERAPQWPGWLKDTVPFLRLETYGPDWGLLEKKPKKYLCGVLLGCTHLPSEIDWLPKYDSLELYKDYRVISIMPLGYKFKKGSEIPLLKDKK